ncbi:HEAT repeat domain-containing protein [Bremerella cremea]|uniref:HEAT repeat domain-containing protein n=1 Tax=Bremerella cremea TaxID=1031537 RepID=UPI0011C0359D|nr:HEAT repeat domain-containing protein [Bremerella cremea]
MNRTPFIFAFSLLVAVSCLVPVQAATLEQSIQALGASEDATRVAAMNHLGSLGSEAAPAVDQLVGLLKDKSPEIRAHAAHALGQIGVSNDETLEGLVELTGSNEPMVRREAVSALFALHPSHQKLLPIFTKMLGDSDPAVRLRLMNAITESGKAAVPGLISALQNEKSALWACLILRQLGPEAADAAPALAKLVADGKGIVRREALLALASMPKAASAYQESIATCLEDSTLVVPATYALGRIGNMPNDVEAKVKANVESKDPMVATMSAWALAFTHPDDEALKKDAIHRLATGIGSSNPIVRAMSSQGLISLQAEPETLKAELQDPLNEAGEPVVSNAVGLLSTMGPAAIDYLLQALKYPSTRYDAIVIIGNLGEKGEPATDALIELIDDDNPRIANEAIVSLGKIGPAAKSATTRLTKSLQEGQGVIAHNSAMALGRIGPAAAAAKSTLLSVMKSESDPALQLTCAWALLQIDPDSETTKQAVLPVLNAAKASKNQVMQKAATEMLGSLNGAK